MLGILSGLDEADPASLDAPMSGEGKRLDGGVREWRVVVASGEYLEDCDPDVLKAAQEASAVFVRMGASVAHEDLSYLREAALANGLMTQADAATVHRDRLAEQPMLFGADVRLRLETGRDLPVGDYVKARRTQAEMRHRLTQLLRDHDVILLPSTPVTAPMIEGGDAVEHARRLTRFTAPFNLTGLPAISVPCGFSHSGLPIGLQLVSGAWQEAPPLRAARAFERETDWANRRPPLL